MKRHALKKKEAADATCAKRLQKLKELTEAQTAERATTATFWAEKVLSLEPKEVATLSGSGNGRTCTEKFERHVRGCMSTGASAAAVRQQVMLDAKFFCSETQLASVYIPEEQWFRDQREALGHEAWVHAMLDVAAADDILQHGFDETQIDRQSTMNQWTLIREDGKLRVVTLEAGGIMIGGTAQMVASHTVETWRRGNQAVEMVREELI